MVVSRTLCVVPSCSVVVSEGFNVPPFQVCVDSLREGPVLAVDVMDPWVVVGGFSLEPLEKSFWLSDASRQETLPWLMQLVTLSTHGSILEPQKIPLGTLNLMMLLGQVV